MHRMYRAHTHTHTHAARSIPRRTTMSAQPTACNACNVHPRVCPQAHAPHTPTPPLHRNATPQRRSVARRNNPERGITTRALRDAQPGVTAPCPRRSKLAEEVHAWPSRGQSNIEFPGQGGTTGRSRHRPGMRGVGVATEEQPATSARRESFPDYSSRPRTPCCGQVPHAPTTSPRRRAWRCL